MRKALKITYYVLLVLLSAMMLFSAYGGFAQPPEAVALMAQLGYPMYVLTMLSVAKVLGVIGVWQTKFPNLREWAYAGFFFDFAGAALSYAFIGDMASAASIGVMMLVLVVAPYALMRKLHSPSRS